MPSNFCVGLLILTVVACIILSSVIVAAVVSVIILTDSDSDSEQLPTEGKWILALCTVTKILHGICINVTSYIHTW